MMNVFLHKQINAMFVGAHISKEKTLAKTIDNVKILGGSALQFFTSNPRRKEVADLKKYETEVEIITEKYKDIALVVHASYIINVATQLDNVVESDIFKIILNDLIIADMLKAVGVVIHVGKSTSNSVESSLVYMEKFINIVISYMKEMKMETKLLLETAAGQGTELLVDIEKFIDFYNLINEPQYFGLCFDTCHVWSAGFDITHAFNTIQDKTDQAISVIHLNGSKTKQGSHVDRHESLDTGHIPLDTIKEFIKNISHDCVIVLETPDKNKYEDEIKLVLNEIKT